MSRQRSRRQPGGDTPITAHAAELRIQAAAARRVSRRVVQSLSHDAARGGSPGDAQVLRRLRSERVTGMGRVVYSSNAVFVLEMEGPDPTRPDQPLRAIYKPARGERPLWDFPMQTLHLREVAAYLVSAALEDGIVPATTLRDGPHGPGSVQLFVHPPREDTEPDPAALEEQLRGIAALDVLINNADRKRAHLLLGDGGRVHGIDNALSFLPYPRQRTVLIAMGGQPLPEVVARRVRQLAGDADRLAAVDAELAELLDDDEVTAFDERLQGLAAAPLLPHLDPWDGRPFEWW